jgi:D-beta-D-heptose 7-phosphate kinase/D-beta-D-heptose 1-phosphate adenosyltransferase
MYADYFKRFSEKNILVIGDLILDHYIWGLVERISPEAPVPVVDVKRESYALGGAANVASNIVSLGGKVTIVGVRGYDAPGEQLESLLRVKGIDTKGLILGSRPTSVKTRVIAHSQQVVRFDREDRRYVSEVTLRKIMDFMISNRKSWDGIIVSDYKKGVISEKIMSFILKEFKSKDIFVAVDPKTGHFNMCRGVSLITPNTKEASDGAGIDIKDEKTLVMAGERLRKTLECDAVLITRGELGMSLFEDDTVTHIPTVARSVYDVSGAGDTVIATITLAHVAGATLKEAAEIANHAAGIVVSQVGTATATSEEILQSMKEVQTGSDR